MAEVVKVRVHEVELFECQKLEANDKVARDEVLVEPFERMVDNLGYVIHDPMANFRLSCSFHEDLHEGKP